MPAPLLPVPSLEEFRTALRRHGLKATRQRIAIHDVMMELVHASADDVREALRLRGSDVTTASVYNILSQLADHHIYARRLSATSKMFFDVVTTRHIHLYDRENHTFRDLQDEELQVLVNSHLKRRKFKGFSVEDIDVQLIAHPTKSNKTKSI